VFGSENNLGKALINLGGCLKGAFEISKTRNKLYLLPSKRTWDAKAPSREGNSPDHKLKTLNKNLVLKDCLVS